MFVTVLWEKLLWPLCPVLTDLGISGHCPCACGPGCPWPLWADKSSRHCLAQPWPSSPYTLPGPRLGSHLLTPWWYAPHRGQGQVTEGLSTLWGGTVLGTMGPKYLLGRGSLGVSRWSWHLDSEDQRRCHRSHPWTPVSPGKVLENANTGPSSQTSSICL